MMQPAAIVALALALPAGDAGAQAGYWLPLGYTAENGGRAVLVSPASDRLRYAIAATARFRDASGTALPSPTVDYVYMVVDCIGQTYQPFRRVRVSAATPDRPERTELSDPATPFAEPGATPPPGPLSIVCGKARPALQGALTAEDLTREARWQALAAAQTSDSLPR